MKWEWRDTVAVCVGVLFLLVSSLCHAGDVRIVGAAAYQVGGRLLTWAGATPSAINNTFVIDVPGPNSGVCVQITNFDTLTHTFTITAAIVIDVAVTGYTGNTGAWLNSPLSPNTSGSIPLQSSDSWWINAAGAAHVAISISGGAGAGVATLTFSQAASSCVGSSVNSNGSVCNDSRVGTVAVSTTISLVPAPPAGQFIHVCAYAVGGDVAANGTLVQFSYGATCAAVGTVVWHVSPHTGGSNYNQGAGLGQLFQTRTAGQPLCVTQGASGATQFVSVSFIYF